MTTKTLFRSAAALAVMLLSAACGTGSTTPASPPGGAGSSVAIVLSPDTATVEPDGQLDFTATVTGTADGGVTWAVVEGSAGGTIAQGKYKASSAEGLFHVVATSTADPTKTATASVTASRRRLSVTPSSAAVGGCQTATFVAKLTGGGSSAVTWSVQEGSAGGAVSAAGVYTAPAAAGTYHVVAVSTAGPTKVVTVPVTVTTKVLSVSMSPGTLALAAGGSQQLGATVVTTCGSFTSP